MSGLTDKIVSILDEMEAKTTEVLNDMDADINAGTEETADVANSYGTSDGELSASEMFKISDKFNKFSQTGTTAVGGQNKQDEIKQTALRRLS